MVAGDNSFLLSDGVVLPCDGERGWIEHGAVLVLDGRIAAVGTATEISHHPDANAVPRISAERCIVMPGLHNTHVHSGLLRGTAESLALWEWLERHVDPAHRALTAEIAESASWMAYAEGLLAGTTSVLDMWRFMEGSVRAAEQLGIRATLAPYTADRFDWFESMASNRALLESHRSVDDGRIRAWVGLEHMFYCSPEMFAEAVALAEEFDVGIHTHCSETIWEVEESVRQFGRRPLEVFHERGLLDGRTVLAHGVWLDDREVELAASTGTAIVHCPCSNMKLASGPAPVGTYRERGVIVGLGTDGEKENNSLDMVEEMKFASLLAKVSGLDPIAGDPMDVIQMATLDGARALGIDDVTGSIEPGKDADLIAVSLDGLRFVPLLGAADFNASAHLVFTANGGDVRDVWVRGRPLVRDHQLLTADVDDVAQRAQQAAEELFERRRTLAPTSGNVAV